MRNAAEEAKQPSEGRPACWSAFTGMMARIRRPRQWLRMAREEQALSVGSSSGRVRGPPSPCWPPATPCSPRAWSKSPPTTGRGPKSCVAGLRSSPRPAQGWTTCSLGRPTTTQEAIVNMEHDPAW